MTDIRPEDLFEINEATRCRGHKYKLGKVRPRLEVRAHSFALRVVNSWNRLPDDVVEASSVGGFKAKLDKSWVLIFPGIK